MSAIYPFDIQRIEKPWGYELLLARTSQYMGKLLHVRAGFALSLQYHNVKEETIYLNDGEAVLHYRDASGAIQQQPLQPGTSLHIPPGAVHRLEAVTDCNFFEVSTPQLDDIVRLDDRYGR